MAGIRSFNTNLPHVFRFPEWVEGIYYPKGSVVAEYLIDNGALDVTYYISIVDNPALVLTPQVNPTEWRVLFEENLIDSDVLLLLSDSDFIQRLLLLDSEIARIRTDMDSDRHQFLADDSDIRIDLDSDVHQYRAADSDIRLQIDSETHDRKSADSELLIRILDNDSDILELQNRTDSDIIVAILGSIDSEILARMSADSDFQVFVDQAVHDFLSNDSEHDSEILELKARLDSEFHAAIRDKALTGNGFPWGPQPFISSTEYYINQGTITNHTSGYLWLVDHDDVTGTRTPTIRIIKDGVMIDSAPGDLLTTEFTTINGVWTRLGQITDGGGGADVAIYGDIGDAVPEVTNANIFIVGERVSERALSIQTPSMDDALRRTVTTVIQIDSDLHVLMQKDSDFDSDFIRIKHDIASLDSDVAILKADRDSDTAVIQLLQTNIDSERHDWRAADSDLLRSLTTSLDSDIKLSLDHDSELNVQMDSEENARKNADSDIYNKYHGVVYRYIKSEHSALDSDALAAGGPYTVDFDAAGAVLSTSNYGSGWNWNTFNNRLVITDSEHTVLYNEIHLAEPITITVGQVEYRRGDDTLVNADAQLNGVTQVSDDIFEYSTNFVSKTWQDGFVGKIQAIIDSDINLHDKDSDDLDRNKWIADKIYQVDSDMLMETHDRKAADSDIIAEFRIPEETITLANGVSFYTLTNPLLNENTSWRYRAEIDSNQQIYFGIVNDHFEIEHDGTAWTIEVDGVNEVSITTVFATGAATVSGTAINVPWDNNSTVTISPLSTDNDVSILQQFATALNAKNVDDVVYDGVNPILTFSASGRTPPDGNVTLNGINFTYSNNAVPAAVFYYDDGDKIKITLK